MKPQMLGGVSMILDYGFGPKGLGVYAYEALTGKILLFIKDK